MKTSEKTQIWRILGNISALMSALEAAEKSQDWQKVNTARQYLATISSRLDALTVDKKC